MARTFRGHGRITIAPGALQRRGSVECIAGVYFLLGHITGRIKIGYSKDVEVRILDIAAECSEPLTLLKVLETADRQQEFRIHRRFAHLRVMGEWFESDTELMTLIGLVGRNRTGQEILAGVPSVDMLLRSER